MKILIHQSQVINHHIQSSKSVILLKVSKYQNLLEIRRQKMKQVSLYPNGRVHTENSNQLMEINLLCFDPVHRWDQSSTAEVVVCFDRNKDPFPLVFHKPPIYSKHSLAHTVNSSTISIVIYFTLNHFNMWLHNIQNDLHKQNNKSSGLISTWLWQLRRWNFICIGIKSKPIHNMKDDIIIQTLPKNPGSPISFKRIESLV